MALNLQNSSIQISAGFARQFPTAALPQIALSGRSNVGKSSLLNTLLGRRALARVSSSPGKTVTVNFYNVDNKLYLVDLPGYGFARRAEEDRRRWSELTDAYFTANPNSDLLRLTLQLVDLEVGPTSDDLMMIDYLTRSSLPFAIIASKADKPTKTARAAAIDALNALSGIPASTPIIPFSAKSGEGREAVLKLVLTAAGVR